MGLKERLLSFKRRGMTEQEYREHKEAMKRKRSEEQKNFDFWKVEEKYKQKREKYRASGGGDSILEKFANYTKGVNENIATMYGLSAPRKKSKKRRKKRR